MKSLIKVWFFLALFLTNGSYALELAGLPINETVQVSDTTLKLNGAGVRNKTFFNVSVAYVAALYLGEQAHTAEDVFNAAGPKEMKLTIVRDIANETLRQAFKDVDTRNAIPAEKEQLKNQFREFDQLFTIIPKLKRGETISIEWIPDNGTSILVNGKQVGKAFPDELFFNVLLRIWLGENPIDLELKKQLLGG